MILKREIIFYTYLGLLFSFSGCAFKSSRKAVIEKYCLVSDFPVVYPDGTLYNYRDTVFLYKNGDQYLIANSVYLNDRPDAIRPVRNKDTMEFEFSIAPGNKFTYTYYYVDSRGKCYIIDSLRKPSFNKTISVDSLRVNTGLGTLELAEFDAAVVLSDSVLSTDKKQLWLTYLPKSAGEDGDTLRFFYQKEDGPVDSICSVSRYFDRTYNPYKLVKFQTIYNSKYSEQYQLTIPGRELKMELLHLKTGKTDEEELNFFKSAGNRGQAAVYPFTRLPLSGSLLFFSYFCVLKVTPSFF